jgi:hypothetical protein
VYAYWNERRGGWIRPAIPGHSLVSSLVALGLAVGGRHVEAELIADRSMSNGRKVCGGLATWAQCHVFDSRGGVSEGISALANFDGIQNYENCGFLFFDSRLSGYGARFALDREERGRGKSAALRLYENSFDRVLRYTGYAEGKPFRQPLFQAPIGWSEPSKALALESGDVADNSLSIFDRIRGPQRRSRDRQQTHELVAKASTPPSLQLNPWEPSCEDVLTWMPPTPQFLSDATLLLLRFTLNGTISTRNGRWEHIGKAWTLLLDSEKKDGSSVPFDFCPLIRVVASLLFPPTDTGGDTVGNGQLASALHGMGALLKLRESETIHSDTTSALEVMADSDPAFWLPAIEDGVNHHWKAVVKQFISALDGFEFHPSGTRAELGSRPQFWEFDARPILEHAVVYSCCKAGDVESLSLARSICSQGVTFRPNSPEEWWRYSIVLGLLGDQVASEDALQTSINVGGGQGA